MPVYLILMLILFILGVIFITASFVFSGFIMHSHRQPIVKSPKEYDLDYEDVEFKSTDGLNLKGWFIRGKSDKVIIITHPFPFNRHGFIAKNQGLITRFKSDVDLLKSARAFNNAGYSILMFDFRNHGESDKGITGIGLTEYQDILGAMDYLENNRNIKPQKFGFAGFCMGANTTMVAMSKVPERFRDVKCFIAVQPVSPGVFVSCYVRKTYSSIALLLLPLIERMCKWRGGYTFEEMAPLKFCKDIKVPTLYIQTKADPWTELSDIQGFYNETSGPKELLLLEGKKERFDGYNHVGEHPQEVLAFLKKYF